MVRILDAVLVVAVLGGAVWTFQIKHSAEQSAKRIAKLSKQIDDERSKITLLRADWAIMTNPERLQEVADAFSDDLGLVQMRSDQIATMNELPPMKPNPREQLLHAQDNAASGDQLTGSVSGSDKGKPSLSVVPTPTPRASR